MRIMIVMSVNYTNVVENMRNVKGPYLDLS